MTILSLPSTGTLADDRFAGRLFNGSRVYLSINRYSTNTLSISGLECVKHARTCSAAGQIDMHITPRQFAE